MGVSDGLLTCTDAFDEGSAGGGCWICGDGNVETFASTTVRHLARRTIRSPGSYGLHFLARLRLELVSAFWLVKKLRVFERKIQAAPGSIDPKLVTYLGIVSKGTEDEASALGVAEDCLHVIVILAAVMVDGDAAGGVRGLRCFTEDPVCNVYVVRTQLGQQPEGILVVEAPVDQAFERWVRHGTAPIAIAMPVTIDVCHVADFSTLYIVNGGTNPGRVPILMAHLKDLLAGVNFFYNVIYFGHGEGHRLLTVHVVSTFERRDHLFRMKAEGSSDDDSVKVFAVNQSAVVGVRRNGISA